MADRHRHPSGRPIRDEKRGVRSIWRVPDDGPVIPRLKPVEAKANAIGFHAELCGRGDEDGG